MKKILFLTVAISLVSVFIVAAKSPQFALSNLFTFSLCDEPIRYRIDTVDPKFNLTREDFTLNVNRAAIIWNDALDKDLFEYDPKGDLSINLIYDERQFLTNQINQLENTVSSDKQSLNPKISDYENRLQEFKKKAEELNKQVEEWNSKGGAPPDEYKKITEQQQALQNEASQLNSMAQSLNISTHEYNLQVNKLNKTIQTFNSALQERPEEGIFKGPQNTIEIYFNISKNEMVHTIAHELGHALGLGHISNPNAIMYFKTNTTLNPTTDDKAAVEEICKRHNIFEVIQTYISIIANKYKNISF